MYELSRQLTLQQRNEVAVEIKKLFAFQDKNLNDDKLNFFVYELSRGEFPFAAIIKGVRDLHGQDLARIKLVDIKHAIQSGVSWIAEDCKTECPICQMSGIVSMEDSQGHTFTLGCRCSNGRLWAEGVKSVLWNGQVEQIVGGRKLVLVDLYKNNMVKNEKPVLHPQTV